MANTTYTYTVTLDFTQGTVIGLSEALGMLVEWIQEDRVTAGDDLAQVCAETLQHYLAHGDVEPKYAALLRKALAPYDD